MLAEHLTATDQGRLVSIGIVVAATICVAFVLGIVALFILMIRGAVAWVCNNRDGDAMAQPHGDVPHRAEWPAHDWDAGVQTGMFAGTSHDAVERRLS